MHDEDLLMEEAAAAQCAQRPPLSETPDSDAEWDAAAFLRPCDARAASPHRRAPSALGTGAE